MNRNAGRVVGDDDETRVDPDEIEPSDRDDRDDRDEIEDFDVYWAEHGVEPEVRRARILGVEVEVPTDLPLEVEAIVQRDAGQLTSDDVDRVVTLIFGADVFEQWIDAGITSNQFPVICAWGMANGAGRRVTFAEAAELVAEQNAARPTNRAERRAANSPRGSASGRSSSRTSRASTTSARRR
ncbi:hypothetical protein [Parafrankia sp. EUN1f]|uniref:hypothetical protein n=1 Tax=Parafrankia sp. EUN1f TaxID=102897 RepID=UPI0001C46CE9|nr:hypothetical protein [Parafrankia sp. EUN1f]EFC80252.1 hypothetical protein FrEUN1fDRAFT_6646 [Parafrankia sp. EUN1f]